jgi:hypothetical protein
MPSMTSALMLSCCELASTRNILSAKEMGFVVGELAKFGGVEVAEPMPGWEKRPNSDVTVGAPLGANEVCEVSKGGLRIVEEASDMGVVVPSSCVVGSTGCVAPCLSGLSDDMCDGSSLGLRSPSCGVLLPPSLMLSSASSFWSMISLIKPKTLLTMFPTTISLGCARTSLLPTERIRAIKPAASRPR